MNVQVNGEAMEWPRRNTRRAARCARRGHAGGTLVNDNVVRHRTRHAYSRKRGPRRNPYFEGAADEGTCSRSAIAHSHRGCCSTGKFSDSATMLRAIAAAAQRSSLWRSAASTRAAGGRLFGLEQAAGITLMPNTSGARDAGEAIRAAHRPRDQRQPFIKVGSIPIRSICSPTRSRRWRRQDAAPRFPRHPYMPAILYWPSLEDVAWPQ